MTTTDATGSLLENFQNELNKEKPSLWEFNYKLQVLLERKYNPSATLTESMQKSIDEFEKYFDWEESYEVNYRQSVYVQHEPSGTIQCDDLDELKEILSDPEEYKYDERIDSGNEDFCIQDLDVTYEDRSFEDFSVSVTELQLKPEYQDSPSREILEKTVRGLFYHNLSDYQIRILKCSDKDLLSDVIDEVKKRFN